MVGVLVGRDAAEVERRAEALLVEFGQAGERAADWLGPRRRRWIAGTPDEARSMVGRFAEAGIQRIMLQDFLPRDLDHIDLMAEELIGRS
jgi:alkanesulfonate monooxygenase SsuD/methylene tetrahydromethanopterin reductase-like flavin-dependent oxidoreductase (luciferase family)